MKKFLKAAWLTTLVCIGTMVFAASQERYLHVNVHNPKTNESVRVNVPLSLAEKVIPAINHGELRNGKIRIGELSANDVDVRAIVDALKSAPEGEFVTVQKPGSEVRVAKERGQIVAHVADNSGKEKVDVMVPWEVAQALISNTTEGELNVEAAIKALEGAGDVTLVTVTGNEESVRVWVDSRSSDK